MMTETREVSIGLAISSNFCLLAQSLLGCLLEVRIHGHVRVFLRSGTTLCSNHVTILPEPLVYLHHVKS